MTEMTEHAGTLLREWRRRRNVSQLELANRSGVSTRHVSFVETGRSRPTSDMIIRLCEQLAVPLREQNRLLLAGGYAPAYPEHRLSDPPMAQVAVAIESILQAHLPYPALVIDSGWELVSANEAVYSLITGVAPRLVEPPINVITLTLDPEGLAPRIVNLVEWRDHLIARLRRDYDVSQDPRLRALLERHDRGSDVPRTTTPGLVVPLRLRVGDGGDGGNGDAGGGGGGGHRAGELRLLSTTTVFGTPREVTVSELAIEAFYPADEHTRAALRRLP